VIAKGPAAAGSQAASGRDYFGDEGRVGLGRVPVLPSVLALSIVVGLLVFAFLIPSAGAVTSLVLAVGALLSLLVFGPASRCHLPQPELWPAGVQRQSGDRLGIATAAMVLAAVAVVALVAIIIGDAVSS
jgi:hypothetical protein